GAREESETLGVVGIIAGGSAIERVAIEKLGILDKIKPHPGLRAAGDHRSEAILVVEGNRDAANHGGCVRELGLPVARQINTHLMPQGCEGAGQSADHVGQASDLGKRNPFRCRECDMHQNPPGKTRFSRARYDGIRVAGASLPSAIMRAVFQSICPRKRGSTCRRSFPHAAPNISPSWDNTFWPAIASPCRSSMPSGRRPSTPSSKSAPGAG